MVHVPNSRKRKAECPPAVYQNNHSRQPPPNDRLAEMRHRANSASRKRKAESKPSTVKHPRPIRKSAHLSTEIRARAVTHAGLATPLPSSPSPFSINSILSAPRATHCRPEATGIRSAIEKVQEGLEKLHASVNTSEEQEAMEELGELIMALEVAVERKRAVEMGEFGEMFIAWEEEEGVEGRVGGDGVVVDDDDEDED